MGIYIISGRVRFGSIRVWVYSGIEFKTREIPELISTCPNLQLYRAVETGRKQATFHVENERE